MKSISDVLKNKDTFIFDMDGTLVDLEKLNFDITGEVLLEAEKKDLTQTDYVKYFSGTHVEDAYIAYFNHLKIPFTGKKIKQMSDSFRTKKRFQLEHNLLDVVKVKPNAREFLELLDKKNFKIGLATSSIKEFAMRIIKGFKMEFFQVILTSEDVQFGKPHPDVFNLAVEKLNSKKDKSIIFEDSPNGIQAALSSEIEVIAILNPGINEGWASKATAETQFYLELIKAIKNE